MSEAGLPDVTQGMAEPDESRVVLTIIGVGLISLMGLFTVVFGWDNFPVISELIPLFDALGSGGIWYYMLGILVAFSLLFAKILAEVLAD
jgi:hypothetical protein